MPNFNIIKEIIPDKSFRVQSIIGKFDLRSDKFSEIFRGEIDLPEK